MAVKQGNRLKAPLKAGRVVITVRKFTGVGKAHRLRGRQRRGRS